VGNFKKSKRIFILAGICLPVLLMSGALTSCIGPAPAGEEQTTTGPASITVSPEESYNPVMTQHTIIAEVLTGNGGPAENTTVVWILNRFPDAVGDVVSAYQEQRDAPRDNHYVSTTTDDNGEAKLTITSTRPGDTDVTAYVPDIEDATKHKVFSTKHWLNLQVEWPESATNLAGTSHVFTTKLTTVVTETQLPGYPAGWTSIRRGVGDPAPGYKVRWSIIDDSPPAYFAEGNKSTKVWTSTTDRLGEAAVTLEQIGPASGENVILIEVLAPDDVPMFTSQVNKAWVSPTLQLTKSGPDTAILGSDFSYTVGVKNTGDVAATAVIVRDTIPSGLTYVSSQPKGTVAGNMVSWNLGKLDPDESQNLSLTVKAAQEGRWTNVARATSAEGLEAEARATTQVIAPSVDITKVGTTAINLGDNASYTITVENTSNVTLSEVTVKDDIPQGMSYVSSSVDAQQAGRLVTWSLGSMNAGATKQINLSLKGEDRGTWTNTVTVTTKEGASARAEAKTLVIAEAGVTIQSTDTDDPVVVGGQTTYVITVKNQGKIDVHNLVVVDELPAQTSFVSAQGPMDYSEVAGMVTFKPVAVLNTGESLTFRVTVKANAEGSALNSVTLTYTEFGASVTVQEGTTIYKIN